jgi:hypothetical protein
LPSEHVGVPPFADPEDWRTVIQELRRQNEELKQHHDELKQHHEKQNEELRLEVKALRLSSSARTTAFPVSVAPSRRSSAPPSERRGTLLQALTQKVGSLSRGGDGVHVHFLVKATAPEASMACSVAMMLG